MGTCVLFCQTTDDFWEKGRKKLSQFKFLSYETCEKIVNRFVALKYNNIHH